MNFEKKTKFGDVLGKWNKKEVSQDGNLPFIAKIGSPRSSLTKSAVESEGGRLTTSSLKQKDLVITKESSRTRPKTKSNAQKTKLKSLGDRIKKFDKPFPTWFKKKNSNSDSDPTSNEIVEKKQVTTDISKNSDDTRDLSTAPRPRPQLIKQSSAQRSRRNHLARKQSKKLNKGTSARMRNKNGVCAQRMTSLASFSPPVFEKNYNEKHVIFKGLSTNFVFEDLTPLEIKAFIQAFERTEVHEGDVIIKQGDVGDYFYIIADGEVTFEVNGVKVGSAEKGSSFGELALLYTSPRAATVKAASEPTKLFRVDQRTFRFIMQSKAKESEQEKFILLKELPFLKDFVESDLKRLSEVMTPRKFEEDEYVVRKGEIGDAFYVLQEGEMKVTDISVGDTKYEDVTLGPRDYFGERALITSEPRAANVVGTTSGTAFSIDRYTFEKVLGSFSRVILKGQDKTKLEGLKLLKDVELDSTKFDSLTNLVSDKKYNAKQAIFEENKDTDPAIYFVREGKVQISSKSGDHSALIEAGGYFGDEQLLADVRGIVSRYGTVSADYTATVASENCVCAVLSLEDCRSVFDTKSLEDPQAQKRSSMSSEGDSSDSSGLVHRRSSMRMRGSLVRSSIVSRSSVETLDRKSVLGEGQFGEVWLVSAAVEEESESFALKVQSKENPDQGNALDIIRREINVLQTLDHPFVIDLIHTYETETSIFMLLGLVTGGELWDRIHRQDEDGNWSSGIPDAHAKFYAFVVADTLAYIHSENIVFRDLKPENILIDEDGYPVICDFGFAKVCTDKTYTLCGTPNYLAPEVIVNRGHGASVDHWALGVIIYEMIVGENPFYYDGLDQSSLYEAICQEEYYPLPDDVDLDCFDLIDRLLEKDPMQRLGNLAGREKDILTHEWFDGLDLSKMRCQEIDAPWIPPPQSDS